MMSLGTVNENELIIDDKSKVSIDELIKSPYKLVN